MIANVVRWLGNSKRNARHRFGGLGMRGKGNEVGAWDTVDVQNEKRAVVRVARLGE